MAVEERFKELVQALRALSNEGNDLVRVADVGGDSPADWQGPVEGYEVASLKRAIGHLPESLPAALDAAQKGLKAAGCVVNLDLCRWSLGRCQLLLDRVAMDFCFDVRGGERLRNLQRETVRLIVGWEQWLKAVVDSIARMQPSLLSAQRALAGCALEIAERACGTPVAIHTTNIGQISGERVTEFTAQGGT